MYSIFTSTLSRKLVIYQYLVDHGMVSLFLHLDKDNKLLMLNLQHCRPYLSVINYISHEDVTRVAYACISFSSRT